MKQAEELHTKEEAVAEIIRAARLVWCGPTAESHLYEVLRRYDELCRPSLSVVGE